jgi:hypothetical protein
MWNCCTHSLLHAQQDALTQYKQRKIFTEGLGERSGVRAEIQGERVLIMNPDGCSSVILSDNSQAFAISFREQLRKCFCERIMFRTKVAEKNRT